MPTFKEFLEGQLNPTPPTAKEVQFTSENFSSRVDAPVNYGDLFIFTNPGDPYDLSVPSDPSNIKNSLLPDQQVWERGLVDIGGGESDDRETVSAAFTVVAQAGLTSFTVYGQEFTVAEIIDFATTNGVVVTDKGEFRMVASTVVTQNVNENPTYLVVDYEYTLTSTINNQTVVPIGLDSNTQAGYNEVILMEAGDEKNQHYSDYMVIHIVNDVPDTFSDGIHTVTEDGLSFISGNVVNNDEPGADLPLTFSGWASSNADAVTALNIYGILILDHETGDWQYTLDNTRPATQALTETDILTYELAYTITDNDGDSASGSVTIRVQGAFDEPPLPCTTPTVGGYTGLPATMTAHMSVLTVNLDPDLFTVVDAMNWTYRATPLGWGSARPARMFPVNLVSLATSSGKGGMIAITDVQNDPDGVRIGFNWNPVKIGGVSNTDYGQQVTFLIEPGAAPTIIIPGATVATVAFVVPTNCTQVCWAKLLETDFTFNPLENYHDVENDTWVQIFHMSTNIEWLYACYDLDGTALHYETHAQTVTYDVEYMIGSDNNTESAFTYDNTDVNFKKVSELNVNMVPHSADICAVCTLPPANVMPRLTQWPLHEGPTPECFRSYHSIDGTALWLSEALTPPPLGNSGNMASGHQVPFKDIGSMMTLRFYPNRQDTVDGLVPATDDCKQLFLCHSSQPFTGTGFTSGTDPHPPQLISNTIPNGVALLKTTPVAAADVDIFGAGLGAHLSFELAPTHWGMAGIVGGDGTLYPYIRLTFQRVS